MSLYVPLHDPLGNVRFFGKFKGFIRDNNDPSKRGRLRVFCPQIMGPEDSSRMWLGWAEPCLPWMGGLSSLDFGVPPIPDENDKISVGVWIEFEAGDPEHPIWVGTFPYETSSVSGDHLKIQDSTASSPAGGSLIAAVASGDVEGNVSGFNPIVPGRKEIRLIAKAGYDIVIMSDRGGAIVVGPNGVNMQGVFVRANGRVIESDISKIVL